MLDWKYLTSLKTALQMHVVLTFLPSCRIVKVLFLYSDLFYLLINIRNFIADIPLCFPTALYSLNIEQCHITSRTIQKVSDALHDESVLSHLSIGTAPTKARAVGISLHLF
jgi:hypothetical protein